MDLTALRAEFKSPKISISTANSFLLFIESSNFSTLFSNFHSLIIPCSMRMLSSQSTEVKLTAFQCLKSIFENPNFSPEPFVKMKIDHLWMDSLIGNFTFKDSNTMMEIFRTVDSLVSHCHLKHSAEYCQLWDKFSKVFFSSCIILQEHEQRQIVFQVATAFINRLEAATVLYVKDFLLLMESCLKMETFQVCFGQFVPTLLSYIWAVVKEYLGMFLSIAMEFISLNHTSLKECHCNSLKATFKLLSDAVENEEAFISFYQQTALAFPPAIHALLNTFVCYDSTQ
jgi:hypothetical protein